MMLQVVASLTSIILMTRGVIYALRAVNYAPRGVTHDDRHMTIKICLQYKPQVTKLGGNFSQKC
jgi:hypothetical protein